MGNLWRFNRFTLLRIVLLLGLCVLHQNIDFCSSLNTEGLALLRFRERVVSDPFGALLNWNFDDGVENPCSWFGVQCLDGKVVSLNLKDLCLGGTLGPEIRNLMHIRSIVLRNNSLSGVIPKEIGELKELKLLDLGYNNFNGMLPSDLRNDLPLAIFLFDNNKLLSGISSELQIDVNQHSDPARANKMWSTWSIAHVGDIAYRRLLRMANDAPDSSKAKRRASKPRQTALSQSSPTNSMVSSPSPSPSLSASPSSSLSVPLIPIPSPPPSTLPLLPPTKFILPPTPSPAPTPDLSSAAPTDPPILVVAPSPLVASQTPIPSPNPSQPEGGRVRSKRTLRWPIISVAAGASFLFISIVGVFVCRSKKVATVKPWVTGLSGQLQKAFVTGVPKLKRSELVAACEDFSNIIGSSSDGTMYKGTLSSGVEIAVTSTSVKSSKDWSKHLEGHFRKKIDVLSKVNHKNFVNLLGFCEEEEPFSRMMVFEYAPNGTLFEHLHIKEAEHLDWGMRLRIAMGIAYCLEHMHRLSPPVLHKNLLSTSVYLTEDYAAKISDLGFWNEATAAGTESLATPSSDPESNVYSFGVILLEMITGRLPYSMDDGPLVEWAGDYLRKERPLEDMVDSTLKHFHELELEQLCEVIRSCIQADPKQRPTIREVTAQLRRITATSPDGATPKLSPLWWAELEIISTEAN